MLPTAIILLYHRVAESDLDPQLLCVSPVHFDEHLRILRRHYQPGSLSQLGARLPELPRNPPLVVVTFDDGYADNLQQAKPALEKYDWPATVFVMTGQLGSAREFWWDDLARVLLSPQPTPPQLTLSIAGQSYRWDLGAHPPVKTRWHVEMTSDPTPRHTTYREIARLIRPLPSDQKQRVISDLTAWAGVGSDGRQDCRALTESELRALARGHLVEIGSHTVTHPVLSTLTPAAQESELRQSQATLEKLLGKPIETFAYPHGTRADYTAETRCLVRRTGYRGACSNFPGLVFRRADLFQLPRFIVRDWDGPEFAHHLEMWLRG